MATNLDLLQLVTNIVVGALSAWMAGKFGVRRELEQATKARAFDRRLEWYEKTFRMINRFNSSSLEYLLSWPKELSNPSRAAETIGELEKRASELDDCFTESLMFAERHLIKELKEVSSELTHVLITSRHLKNGEDGEVSENLQLENKVESIWQTTEGIAMKLAKAIRKQLNLDEIRPEDLRQRDTAAK